MAAKSFIISGDHILTSGPGGCLRSGAILVEDGIIRETGSLAELSNKYPDLPVEGPFPVVMPGLVNAHTHFSEALIPGMCEDLSIWEWGTALLMPTGAHLTREMARVGTLLKGAELLRGGVTMVSDMFCHSNYGSDASLGVVEGLEELGLRGLVCFGAEDLYGGKCSSLDAIMAEHEALERCARSSKRCHFALGIGTVLGQSDKLFKMSIEHARIRDCLVHTHLAEVREEKVTARLKWGSSTVEHAARKGLMDGPLLAGHGIWLDSGEIDLLCHHQVRIVHNPVANMILGSGICRVRQLRERGITLALGTDGAASNDSHNMIEVLKLAGLLQKNHHLCPEAIDARTVLTMGTIGGAQALGLDEVTGSLEPGKSADILAFSAETPGTAIVHDPYQQIVYGAGPSDVAKVWIHGIPVLESGRVAGVDASAIAAEGRALAKELATQSKLENYSCLTSR